MQRRGQSVVIVIEGVLNRRREQRHTSLFLFFLFLGFSTEYVPVYSRARFLGEMTPPQTAKLPSI